MQLLGIDFTSRPNRRKPITVAVGRLQPGGLLLERVDALADFNAFEALLQQAGPWLAGCDFPFGLPRELVQQQGWPEDWPDLMCHLQTLNRASLTEVLRAFCAARPVGNKFAHRAVDVLARSSPSMKWVNPPVAYMLHEGATRLYQAGVTLPGLHPGDPQRLALEAYPALAARQVIGNASYKSDTRAKQTAERQARRAQIVASLLAGSHPLGIQLIPASPQLVAALVEDGSADLLDATLCLVQAAWAVQQPGYGLPAGMDTLEGWIITTPTGRAATNVNGM